MRARIQAVEIKRAYDESCIDYHLQWPYDQDGDDDLEYHMGRCKSLYNEYIAFLTNAFLKHPGLSDIECNAYAQMQVMLRPEHEVQLEDMAWPGLPENIFDYHIADHAIPALRAHLLTI